MFQLVKEVLTKREGALGGVVSLPKGNDPAHDTIRSDLCVDAFDGCCIVSAGEFVICRCN